MYNLVGTFIKKAIPIKGANLTIVQGLQNRFSAPRAPYIILQIEDENQISTPETRYTDHYKILFSRSEITIKLYLTGNDTIPALQMAKAFYVRFNDSWASEQFEKLSDCFYPLYSDDVKIIEHFINAEDQYDDTCSITCYFEYHAEIGVCEDSAKEIIMNLDLADVETN